METNEFYFNQKLIADCIICWFIFVQSIVITPFNFFVQFIFGQNIFRSKYFSAKIRFGKCIFDCNIFGYINFGCNIIDYCIGYLSSLWTKWGGTVEVLINLKAIITHFLLQNDFEQSFSVITFLKNRYLPIT